ncbi:MULTISPECIES: SAM-dependent methyltransferase [Enterocloster]|uniref:Methyltransferase domain-containing protein n=1 Tax=Enterocloster lavalensis TaxID=460384 RepID=A0A1I0BNU3_9FIRM|nr:MULTISPECIES: SAM-dependent methyltransferase [Enterocloster]MDR3758764.1 SAM-dependent methyltransferase [Enterocloster sp.]SET07967.1 Methyltransferase domain-containing protein [Enterocloster lavalensis]
MNQTEREETTRAVEQFLNESLERILLSNPVNPQQLSRARLRPLLIKGELRFQVEEQAGKQAFHRNLDAEEAAAYVTDRLDGQFRQAEMTSALGSGLILVSKKGKVTVKVKGRGKTQAAPARITPMSHNRQKRYILEEGIAVPFLVDLGVMTKEGRVVNSRYDKFRQINRFLEMVEDVLPGLDKGRENTIIDFGCGKSYLTFAMYYYLRELRGYQVRIIGLDLKEDVIAHCEKLARAYGYEGLSFTCGDIAGYEGVDQVDMVVTLHACDTATDYALAKAVGWGAKVILSVPCCQHELNGQMENQLMGPVFQYGLIKERMAALYTDAIRAQVLEHMGYRTQILEFIDMEHTPKNILIRAVKQGKRKDNEAELLELVKFLNVSPTIVRELMGENDAE